MIVDIDEFLDRLESLQRRMTEAELEQLARAGDELNRRLGRIVILLAGAAGTAGGHQ